VSVPTADQLLAVSQALDEPLESELRLVLRDATNAVRMLATSFLPAELTQARQQ
jgi:hypothetical protein